MTSPVGSNSSFPDPRSALDDPPGLLAMGGDLASRRLIDAYRHGIFPWFEDHQPIMWWSPPERAVIWPQQFKPSRSLLKTLRRGDFQVELNTSFDAVMRLCREHRLAQHQGTWITDAMCDAYLELHNQGLAHAIGCYRDGRLVGGLYGVSVGQLFCGESMVSIERDASKVALAFLLKACTRLKIDLIDCQMPNPHLMSLGAEPMDRDQFLSYLIARRDQADHLQGQKGVFLSYDSDSLLTDPS